ncbi:histidinol phosphate aminotransferase [Rhodobacteraceae bacterium 10Alg 79]|uniref:Histidinol phosphate aminotransferase n=1 Tax=Rhodalgimonas zhirmunskyi TaxID=2964767 RepID=A0AAJ1UGC9_9RHOB|nr:histidinol phosphate aminotransferase [Rhodoalgimonas zhirmunskyi]
MYDRPLRLTARTALLTLGFINLLWSLALLWASFGLPAVLTVAVLLDYMITRFAHRLRRQRMD